MITPNIQRHRRKTLISNGTKGADITKKLGVIGGLGPIATAYFYELIIKMTNAATDQEHMEIIIYSRPSTPDRTEFILGRSKDNPVCPMLEAGRTLVGMGVDYIAIPCITAHYFHDILSEGINAPILNIVKETVQQLADHGVKCAGIMATEGTIQSELFQKELSNYGITAVIPSKEKQELVTHLIYKNVKANQPVEMDKFNDASGELRENGAEVIILGCTELSLIKKDYKIGAGFIDAMEVLAMRSIQSCEGNLKEEYLSLITR